jgi:hypothetical protein
MLFGWTFEETYHWPGADMKAWEDYLATLGDDDPEPPETIPGT